MRLARFVMADAIGAVDAGSVVDLAEYAHPSTRASALPQLATLPAPLAIILPADADRHELELSARSGAKVIVLNDVESVAGVRAAAAALDAAGRTVGLVPRLTTGSGLHAATELAAQPRVAGLWYAAADLLIDFDDEPSQPYYYDGGESRLAAPEWTRSYLLTITRAAGIALWGQLDLSFAAAPPEAERERIERLARLSAFDVLVMGHRL